MKLETKKPRQTIIGNIFETYDYDMFKILEGNRTPNKSHIGKLVISMSEIYLLSPIIVNKDMAIIDGQHRFSAALSLGLPIRYIIDGNADLRAVQLLNAKSKDWSPDDYMESYIKLGYPDYVKYKKFKECYKFSHQVCQTILTGQKSHSGKNGYEDFNNGTYKITHYEYAEKLALFVLQCEVYYSGAKRRSFVLSIAELMKKPVFKTKHFLKKLKSQQSKMYDCAKTSQYIDLIEEIYNYRSQNKVNLRV